MGVMMGVREGLVVVGIIVVGTADGPDGVIVGAGVFVGTAEGAAVTG